MECNNLEFENANSSEIAKTNETQEIQDARDVEMLSPLSSIMGHELFKVSEMPEVKDFINDKIEGCKETFENIKDGVRDAVESAKESIAEFGEKVKDGIKDFCCGVYDDVKEFFEGNEKPNPCAEQFPEAAKLNEGITEGREFGLDKCTEAAQEIFNPGVIAEWSNLSDEERKGLALMYADRVAESFELVDYKGMVIEDLGPGIGGMNCGDGIIYLTDDLLNPLRTPLEVIDTITHEMRHQYQSECVNGYHDVSDEVRNEWAVAAAIYTVDDPCCYDPWGYAYNPLEIDSNYAGNTVVRNVTSQMFNDVVNNA